MTAESSKEPQKKTLKPYLYFDVMVSIGEKIFFSPDNEFRMNLKNLDQLNFMFANRLCKKSAFLQFRRMTKMCISSVDLELYCPIPIEGRFAEKQQFFQGPFNVGDWLIIMLLMKDVLRLKTIDAFYAFGEKSNRGGAFPKKGIEPEWSEDESPVESFVKLFLFKDSPDALGKFNLRALRDTSRFVLDSVKITNNASVLVHFNRILNLNAIEVFLELVVSFAECIDLIFRKVDACRTKYVTLIYSIDVNNPANDLKKFSFTHLRLVLGQIIASCPNVERIYVRFSLGGEFSEEDYGVLSRWLCQTIDTLATQTLVDLDCSCELTIAFRAYFPQSTLVQADANHDKLTKIGQKKVSFEEDEAAVEEDAISSGTSGAGNNPPSYTIARLVNVDEVDLKKKISCTLVGVQEEEHEDDENWNGFNVD